MTIMNNGGKMKIFRYVLVLSCLLSVTACGQKKIPVDSVVFVADEKKISQSPMVFADTLPFAERVLLDAQEQQKNYAKF